SVGARAPAPQVRRAPQPRPQPPGAPAPRRRIRAILPSTRSRSPGLEIFAEQCVVESLGILVLPARVVEASAEGIEGGAPSGLGGLEPSVEHKFRKIPLLFEVAQDGAHFTDYQFEHRDFLVEEPQHLLLQGAAGHEVEDKDLALLADAVDAADTLF